MGRHIEQKEFIVRCVCDRCGHQHVRASQGDIAPPANWQYLHLTPWGPSQSREGALLCGACVAIVIAAASPAALEDPSEQP